MLCQYEECLLPQGHHGQHNKYPTSAWEFMVNKDKNKLVKAGFATPRGGAKGAYQNHVVRSNRVIIPFERLESSPLEKYLDGYVIRVYPEQFFDAEGVPKSEFINKNAAVVVGDNAFVLYRTHSSFEKFPPLKKWQICHLEKDGQPVTSRGKGVKDVGHYVLRMSALGSKPAVVEGPPQGLFAPEYANTKTNYLSKCVLAWLILHTLDNPYSKNQKAQIEEILDGTGISKTTEFENRGLMRKGITCCPLCLKHLHYSELHEMVTFEDELGLENAGSQVEGATRSTLVNLFHMLPLRYDTFQHSPQSVAWGHAICNTRLGQRTCFSKSELMATGKAIKISTKEEIADLGWISEDSKMIRSKGGAVWIQLNPDPGELITEEEVEKSIEELS
ncbi:restriction endonuclease [Candidatus Nomurabacteria bacterium]|nr:restriction endonuclease [Candidatus Nomurabacteria bacterium]